MRIRKSTAIQLVKRKKKKNKQWRVAMGTWIPSKIFSNGPFTLTRVDKGVIVCKENDRNNSSHNGLSFILYKNCTYKSRTCTTLITLVAQVPLILPRYKGTQD